MKVVLLLLPFAALCQEPPAPPAKASIEGHIVSAVGGEPLRKARVSVRMNVAATPQSPRARQGQAPPAPGTAVTTDTTGRFLIENLEPGTYQLTARRDGFVNETLGAQNSRKHDAIVLGPGDHKTELVIKLTPHGVISGRLVDEDGDPIAGMPATLMTYQYTSRGRELIEGRSASSDDRGEYRLYNVPPGKYLLKFAQRGLRTGGGAEEAEYFAAVFYPGVAEPASAAPLEIRPGQELSGMGITLRKAHLATLRGRVIAPPNVGVQIGLMITSAQGQSSSSHNLDDKDGKFEMFAVSPGPVYVTANYVLDGQRYDAEAPLQVGSSDINGIELRPLAPVNLPGRLRIEGESTLKPSQVQVSLQRPGWSNGESARDDGSFLVHGLTPSIYRVAVNQAQLLYVKSLHWGTTDITTGELDLTRGVPPQTELSIVLGGDGAQLEGVVMNDKEPAEGAVVTLIPTGSRRSAPYYKNTTADSAGHFTTRGIAPGPYKLIAWDQVNVNAVIYDPDFLRPYETAGQTVSFDAGEKKSVELKVTVNLNPQ